MIMSPEVTELVGYISRKSYVLPSNKTSVKLYCLSDLHADSTGCFAWIKSNCVRKDGDTVHTVFICAGDISAEVRVLREVFLHLKTHFDDVCFTPGNHDLWRKGTESDLKEDSEKKSLRKQQANSLASCSFSKLKEVLCCAQSYDVHTGPLELLVPTTTDDNNVFSKSLSSIKVLPLFSWYHKSWDEEPDLTNPDFLQAEKLLPFDKKWTDFRMCAWSSSYLTSVCDTSNVIQICSVDDEDTRVAEFFAQLNEINCEDHSTARRDIDNNVRHGSSRRNSDVVVTFSHFLPRQELCPEKKYLLEPNMTKVIGSKFLEEQIRKIEPNIHIFGHTHIPIELTLDDTVYVQWPLGYAREKEGDTKDVMGQGPLMVYDSSIPLLQQKPIQTACYNSRWSQHYRKNSRQDSEITNDELSPWLATKIRGHELLELMILTQQRDCQL